jgi:hypothetical protein
MDIPFATRTLANGLEVVVNEDRHIPMAAVSVWYHVGSRHERPGHRSVHLFEHLIPIAHHPSGYFEAREADARQRPTNTDRTNYREWCRPTRRNGAVARIRTGPAICSGASRRSSLPSEVVLNERRQNYENRPYGLKRRCRRRSSHPTIPTTG